MSDQPQESLSIMFSKIHKEKVEAQIRLYGVLAYLVKNEIISEGKAMELGNKPLREMISSMRDYFLFN